MEDDTRGVDDRRETERRPGGQPYRSSQEDGIVRWRPVPDRRVPDLIEDRP
jgi:hypothetical protein